MMRAIAVVFLLTLLSGVGAAQQPVSNLSQIEFVVTDKQGNALGNLTKDDLLISIDGKDLRPESVEVLQPDVIFALAVDNSGTMRTILDDVQAGAKALLAGSSPRHQAMLMRFVSTDKIQSTPGFSTDKKPLIDIVSRFEIEGGQTAIIDALYLAAERVSFQRRDCSECRRVVIAITDGEERGSVRSKNLLIQLLRRERVEVHFLGVLSNLSSERGFISKSAQGKAKELMQELSEISGGSIIYPEPSKDLEKAAGEMNKLMASRYVAKFIGPVGLPNKFEMKIINVPNAKGAKVHFRRLSI